MGETLTLRERAAQALRKRNEEHAAIDMERRLQAGRVLRGVLEKDYGVVLDADPDNDRVEIEGLVFVWTKKAHSSFSDLHLIRKCWTCGVNTPPAPLPGGLASLAVLIGEPAYCTDHDPNKPATPTPSSEERLLDALREFVGEIAAEEVAACR